MSPYTEDSKERPRKDQSLEPKDSGELTFAITEECKNYLKDIGERFVTHSEILSALAQPLEGMANDGKPKDIFQLKGKLKQLAQKTNLSPDRIRGCYKAAEHEWYRRMVVPYERKKCILNGDVYPSGDSVIALKRIIELCVQKIEALDKQVQLLQPKEEE